MGNVGSEFQVDASSSTDANDPVGLLEVRWDWEDDGVWDTTYGISKTTLAIYSSLGSKTIRLEVRNSAGLTGTAAQTVRVVERRPPSASFVVRPEEGSVDTLFRFDASGSTDEQDATQTLRVRWDWDDDLVWDTPFSLAKTASHHYTDPGTRNVVLEVQNTEGLIHRTTRTVHVTARSSVGPIAAFSVTPASGNVSTLFAMDASTCSDPDDPVDSLWVRWDWEDDGVFDTASVKLKTATHRYLNPGVETIRLEVRDPAGHVAQATRLVVVENTAPVASFGVAPASGPTGTDFRFDATASSDLEDDSIPGAALLLRWDWESDGTWDTPFSTNRVIVHRFDQHGTKTVTLQVRDSGGLTSGSSRAIEVGSGSPPQLRFVLAPNPTPGNEYTRRALFSLDARASTDTEDDAAGVPLHLSVDWGDGTPAVETSTQEVVTHSFGSVGRFDIRIEARDSDHLSNIAVAGPVVIVNQAPTAAFSVTPSSGGAACTDFQVRVAADDLEDGPLPLQLSLRWGDGTNTLLQDGARTANHRYAQGGPYVLHLEVTDSDGAIGVAPDRVLEVAANEAPIPALAVVASDGCLVQFRLTVSDCENTPPVVVARWDWEGDATWDTGYLPVFNGVMLKNWRYGFVAPLTVHPVVEVLDADHVTATASTAVQVEACVSGRGKK